MADKEISLTPGSAPDLTSELASDQDQKPDLSPKVSKLEVKAGMSSADLVDLIISKSADELLPWEPCFLPSKGLYYDGKIPEGRIEVKAMSLVTEKILATARLAQSGESINQLYKKCIKFPDSAFDSQALLVGDRTFLLFYLRGITHGNLYEFAVTCTNTDCKRMSTHEYDLNNITIKYPKHRTEPVKVILPYFSKLTGREIYVEARFMRGYDLQAMLKKRKHIERAVNTIKNDQSSMIDSIIEDNINMVVETVNGVKERHKIEQFISKLHATDTAEIRNFIDNESPGPQTNINILCPHCGEEMKIDLPITDTFFRPKKFE